MVILRRTHIRNNKHIQMALLRLLKEVMLELECLVKAQLELELDSKVMAMSPMKLASW